MIFRMISRILYDILFWNIDISPYFHKMCKQFQTLFYPLCIVPIGARYSNRMVWFRRTYVNYSTNLHCNICLNIFFKILY